jgi:hypothetical protein
MGRMRCPILPVNEDGIVLPGAVQLAGYLHPDGPERVRPRRFTGVHQRLLPLQFLNVREPAGPLRHAHELPRLGLLRALRPITGPSADDAPSRCPPNWHARRKPGNSSHVHHTTDRRVRCPALPQRHRPGYAADLHRSLPAGHTVHISPAVSDRPPSKPQPCSRSPTRLTSIPSIANRSCAA